MSIRFNSGIQSKLKLPRHSEYLHHPSSRFYLEPFSATKTKEIKVKLMRVRSVLSELSVRWPQCVHKLVHQSNKPTNLSECSSGVCTNIHGSISLCVVCFSELSQECLSRFMFPVYNHVTSLVTDDVTEFQFLKAISDWTHRLFNSNKRICVWESLLITAVENKKWVSVYRNESNMFIILL